MSTRSMNDWLKGLLHGSLGAFTGFLAGGLIAAIFALSTGAPVWATGLPYIGAIGGFTFGFAEGSYSYQSEKKPA